MNLPAKTTTDLVDFSGRWSESERTLIIDAAQEVEARRITKGRHPHFPPWIVTRHQTSHGEICVASRFRASYVIRAGGAELLAHRIRHFAHEDTQRGAN